MMRIPIPIIPIVLVTLFSMALIGCRSPLDMPRDGTLWPAADETWRVTPEGLTHRQDTLASASRHAAADDASPGDVEGWVSLALERNAGLRAAERRVQRLGHRRAQVTGLDDPMLEVSPIGQMAQTAAGEVGLMAGVSQRLPFPGKLEARGAMADADAASAAAQLAVQRLRVSADVRRAYWSRVYAERALAVVRRDQGLLDQLREVAEAQYRAGRADQQDVLRAQVERAGLETRVLELTQQRRSVEAALNGLADRPIDAPVALDTAEPDASSLQLELQVLLARAAEHPQLAQLRHELDRFRAARRGARLDRYPDLTVGATYGAVDADGLSPVANGDDQWWLTLGINVPIWQGRRDAAEAEALAGTLETAAMLAEERNQLAFRVRDGLARVQAQRDAIALYETRMLPEARQAVEAAESSYRAGRVEFLTVIDNARRLTELDLLYQRALTQLQQDLAELSFAVGDGSRLLSQGESDE